MKCADESIDVEKVAAAIEADAGESLPDLRQAFTEARATMEGGGYMKFSERGIFHGIKSHNKYQNIDFIGFLSIIDN